MKQIRHDLIFESITVLEIKTPILFYLGFGRNTILSCFVFFLLIIDLHFSIPTAIVKIFNPIAKLLTPKEIPSKEGKAEIEIHPVIGEAKIK